MSIFIILLEINCHSTKELNMLYKTIALSLSFITLSAFTHHLPATDATIRDLTKETAIAHVDNGKSDEDAEEAMMLKMDGLFTNLYHQLADHGKMPQYPVFKKALLGYYNLLAQGKVENKDILTIIDFSLPSSEKRLWIVDLDNKAVLYHDLVAHGRSTGNVNAENFSDTPNSHMSSLGFYVTGETYYGKHGFSLRLEGMEAGFNKNAFARAIVVHGADYVSQDFIKRNGRLGRSYGCPAVSRDISDRVINAIKNKSCMFIYASAVDYEVNSNLLNAQTALEYLTSKSFIEDSCGLSSILAFL